MDVITGQFFDNLPSQCDGYLVGTQGFRITDSNQLRHELTEIGRLAAAVGVKPGKAHVFTIDEPDPNTYIKSGAIRRLKYRPESVFVFNNTLSPRQHATLRSILETPIMDRNDVILRIFEQRAHSREAQVQVKLARLRHEKRRIYGWGEALEQQEGGIGGRGPGETKKELQRRDYESQEQQLKQELDEIREQRDERRKRRTDRFRIGLLGYTNAGKSTLLNALAENDNADVKDRPFSTLDTRVRRTYLGNGTSGEPKYGLLTDTVGFVSRMPPQLKRTFASTFEEARESDLLLHIVDSSDKFIERKRQTGEGLIQELGLSSVPVLRLYNKVDRLNGTEEAVRTEYEDDDAMFLSARTGDGVNRLRKRILKHYRDSK